MNSITRFFIVMIVVVFAAGSVFAQADIGFKGIGAKLGLVDPDNVDMVIGFGVFADLGTITPNIGLEANIDYWSKSESEPGVEVSFRDVVVGATGKYLFAADNGAAFRPFALAGLAFHLFKSEVEFENDFFGFGGSESETRIGIDVGGGFFYTVTPQIDVVLDARYRLVSDINQLYLKVGGLYHLGQ